MSLPRLDQACRRQPLWWLSLALLLAVAPPLAASKVLYRYVDNRGVIVIEDHIPPEFVKNGYSVVTPDGRVLETVPRQLSGEEGRRRREVAAEARRLQAWDESLLRRYSSVQDIESARDRAVNDYTLRIGILRSNLLGLKSQIEREQATAADYERSGQSVPQSLVDTLAALRQELLETEQAVAQRRAEVAELKASFERDIVRFGELKALVEWRRRQQSAGDDQ